MLKIFNVYKKVLNSVKLLDFFFKCCIFASQLKGNRVMKTYFCIYKTAYTEKQFIIAAHDQFEAETVAYLNESVTSDGTKYYPLTSDFRFTELSGCSNRQKVACIIQQLPI